MTSWSGVFPHEMPTRLPELYNSNRGYNAVQSVSPSVDIDEMIRMMNREGIELCGAKMLSEAENVLLKASELAKEVKDKQQRLTLISITNNNIGYVMKLKGSLDAAAGYVESALKIEYQLNKPSASTTLNLTAVLNAKGLYNKARDLAKLTLDLLNEEEANGSPASTELWVAAWHNIAVAQLHATTGVLSAEVVWNQFATGQKIALKGLGKNHPLTKAITESYKSAKASWLRTKLNKGKRREVPQQSKNIPHRSPSLPRKKKLGNRPMFPSTVHSLNPEPPSRHKNNKSRAPNRHQQQSLQSSLNPTEALLEYSGIDPYSGMHGGWGADVSEAWVPSTKKKSPAPPTVPPPVKSQRNATVNAKPQPIQRPKKNEMNDHSELVQLRKKIEHLDTQPLPPLSAPVAQDIEAPQAPNVPRQAVAPEPVNFTGFEDCSGIVTVPSSLNCELRNDDSALRLLEEASPYEGTLGGLWLLKQVCAMDEEEPDCSYIDLLMASPSHSQNRHSDEDIENDGFPRTTQQLLNYLPDSSEHSALRFLVDCETNEANQIPRRRPNQLNSVMYLLNAAMLDDEDYNGLAMLTNSISEVDCGIQYSSFFKDTQSSNTAQLLDIPGHKLEYVTFLFILLRRENSFFPFPLIHTSF